MQPRLHHKLHVPVSRCVSLCKGPLHMARTSLVVSVSPGSRLQGCAPGEGVVHTCLGSGLRVRAWAMGLCAEARAHRRAVHRTGACFGTHACDTLLPSCCVQQGSWNF